MELDRPAENSQGAARIRPVSTESETSAQLSDHISHPPPDGEGVTGASPDFLNAAQLFGSRQLGWWNAMQ